MGCRLVGGRILKEKTWYRGSVRRDPLSMIEGQNETEQFGPGIYFTDNIETATSYAYPDGKIYAYNINTDAGFYKKGDKIRIGVIKKIVSYADQDVLDIALSDWSEDKDEAYTKMINSIVKYSKDMPDALQQTCRDVFNWDREDFILSCKAVSVNGFILKDPFDSQRSESYLVLYNTKLASLVETYDYF